MILRNTNYGPALDASGARGFFKEGYRHHRLLGPFGPNFSGCTFVAKTTTLHANQGNMPLKEDRISPRELMPACIKAYIVKGLMLNAVGLSGPGAKFLLETGRWQEMKEDFFISFMSIGKSASDRISELERFLQLLAGYLPKFKAKVGLQINYSCPNVGIDSEYVIEEARIGIQKATQLCIPVMPKFNILVSPRAVKELCKEPGCDAICISNTLPWGKLPDKINWKKLFGSEISPLAKFGGGGLSGRPLLPLVLEWIYKAKYCGVSKPLNAGGGIMSADDVSALASTGLVKSIFIGSVATLRPWRVKSIITKAHQLF